MSRVRDFGLSAEDRNRVAVAKPVRKRRNYRAFLGSLNREEFLEFTDRFIEETSARLVIARAARRAP